MSNFRIRGIPAPMIDKFWQFAEPYIKRALDHTTGEFSPADIKMYCKDRVIQLWLVSEGERVIGAATTEMIVYPQAKHCRVVTIGGSKAVEWMPLLDETLLRWAKENKCVAMEAFVRKGFVPVLVNNYGYKHQYSAVFKRIE